MSERPWFVKWWQIPKVAEQIGPRSVELLNEIELRRAELAGICVRSGHVLGPEQVSFVADNPPFPPRRVPFKHCLRCGAKIDCL